VGVADFTKLAVFRIIKSDAKVAWHLTLLLSIESHVIFTTHYVMSVGRLIMRWGDELQTICSEAAVAQNRYYSAHTWRMLSEGRETTFMTAAVRPEFRARHPLNAHWKHQHHTSLLNIGLMSYVQMWLTWMHDSEVMSPQDLAVSALTNRGKSLRAPYTIC